MASENTPFRQCWSAGPIRYQYVSPIFFYLSIVSFSSLSLAAKPLIPALKDLISQPSISAGVGLIYRFDPIRVEVNFGMPLVAAKSDTLRRGIQVGIGLEFL